MGPVKTVRELRQGKNQIGSLSRKDKRWVT